MAHVIQTLEQQFFLTKLLGYYYKIMYKPDAQNKVADALSRIHCLALEHEHDESFQNCQMDFITKLKAQLEHDESFQRLLHNITTDLENHKEYQHSDGLVFYKGKLFITRDSPFKQLMLEEFHVSPMGGHNGIHLTFGRLQENIFWEGMRNNVITFIRNCVICQQMKPANHAPYGLLQPFPVPDKVWEYISLDFITGLHSFPNHTVFMVVVDRLSKASHFVMLPTQFIASKFAKLFASMVYKLHDIPRSMVFDRDPIFLSHFWQDLFRLSDTKMRMSPLITLKATRKLRLSTSSRNSTSSASYTTHPNDGVRFFIGRNDIIIQLSILPL